MKKSSLLVSSFKKIVTYVSVLLLVFAVGSFFPNPYTKYKLRLNAENFYTNWANNLGLQEPAFSYNNDINLVMN